MMNRFTGAALDPASDEHLMQSIGDILTTPLATRPMLRPYGSTLPDQVDQPANAVSRIRLYAAAAMALQHWEPRVRLKAVRLVADAVGRASLKLTLIRQEQPRRGDLDLVIPLPNA